MPFNSPSMHGLLGNYMLQAYCEKGVQVCVPVCMGVDGFDPSTRAQAAREPPEWPECVPIGEARDEVLIPSQTKASQCNAAAKQSLPPHHLKVVEAMWGTKIHWATEGWAATTNELTTRPR